jgi:hypothetical protein
MESPRLQWQQWKSQPMTRAEFVLTFATGLVVLILVELLVHS